MDPRQGRQQARQQMLESHENHVRQLVDELNGISPNHPEPHATWVRAFLGEKLRLAQTALEAVRAAIAHDD